MSSARHLPNLEPAPKSVADEYIPGEFGDDSSRSNFSDAVASGLADHPITSPPVLILAAPSPPEAKFGTLFWLAHTLGLDVYGTTTLSYAARSEMIAVSLMLTIIFLFDAAAWCLLFYFILTSGGFGFHFGSLLLCLVGILPALALLLYERGFMTADTKTYGWRRLILPTALRLCAVFAGAWITAQPVELMAFARRIDRRVQDELIRKDIVSHYHKLQKAQADQSRGNIALVDRDKDKLDQAEADLKAKSQHLPEVEAELEKLQNARNEAKKQLDEANNRLRESEDSAVENPQSPAARDLLAQRQQAAQTALKNYNDRAKKAAEQDKALQVLNKSIEAGAKELPSLRAVLSADFNSKTARDTEDKLLAWADKIRNLEPRTSYPDKDSADPETGFKFIFADYTFLDKFRIIDDLRAGRPARWPGAEEDKIQTLRATYGLYDDNDNSSAAGAQQRLAAETSNAQRTYYAVFGVALIIPFMSLLFKLIMPAPLSYYYSMTWQSRQGHPEAMAMEAATISMNAQSRQNGNGPR